MHQKHSPCHKCQGNLAIDGQCLKISLCKLARWKSFKLTLFVAHLVLLFYLLNSRGDNNLWLLLRTIIGTHHLHLFVERRDANGYFGEKVGARIHGKGVKGRLFIKHFGLAKLLDKVGHVLTKLLFGHIILGEHLLD